MHITTYSQAISYLESLVPHGSQKFPAELGMDRMRTLCDALGNPEKDFISIHIAGTSGKGSTAAFLSQILIESGFKTGLHISPHVITYRERMQINGSYIPEDLFTELVDEMAGTILEVSKKFPSPVSFFEAITALAFLFFSKQQIDVAVVETGMGGTYDATNVLPSVMGIITPIGFDHEKILGNSLSEIAENKAGIIKASQICVVSANQRIDAEKIIKKTGESRGVRVIELKDAVQIHEIEVSTVGTSWKYQYDEQEHKLHSALIGTFQAQNASLAVTAALEFGKKYGKVTTKSVLDGIKNAAIPVRFEMRTIDTVQVILDGAHNPDKMKACTDTYADLFPNLKPVVLLACKRGKNLKDMLEYILPIAGKIITTRFTMSSDLGKGLDLSMSTDEIAQLIGENTVVIQIEDPIQAFNNALTEARNKGVPLLVTGSLFIGAEIREHLEMLG